MKSKSVYVDLIDVDIHGWIPHVRLRLPCKWRSIWLAFHKTMWYQRMLYFSERHGISNHWQPNCLFQSSSKLTTNKTSKLYMTGPLWGKSTGRRIVSFAKRQYCGKSFNHEVIMYYKNLIWSHKTIVPFYYVTHYYMARDKSTTRRKWTVNRHGAGIVIGYAKSYFVRASTCLF